MSYVMASGGDERRPGGPRGEGNDERRERARRNAKLLALLAAALYVGFLVLGSLKGIFPG